MPRPPLVHRSVHRCGDRGEDRRAPRPLAAGSSRGSPGKFASAGRSLARRGNVAPAAGSRQGAVRAGRDGPHARVAHRRRRAPVHSGAPPPAADPCSESARSTSRRPCVKRTFQPNNRKRREDPRLPHSDADARRASRAPGPPSPWPEAALGLIWRVRDRATFEALARARRHRVGPVSLRFVRRRIRRPAARRVRRSGVGRVRRSTATGSAAACAPRSRPAPTSSSPGGAYLFDAERAVLTPRVRRPRARRSRALVAARRGSDGRDRAPTPSRARADVRRPAPDAPDPRWRLLSVHLPPRCRFHPSCSQYALEALELHGARRGTWLAVRRVGRCHPWHPGGFDPVPEPNVRSTHVAAPDVTEES